MNTNGRGEISYLEAVREDTPVKMDQATEWRSLLNLTLSVDHWVVDGAAAARFLAELKATLENPYLLI